MVEFATPPIVPVTLPVCSAASIVDVESWLAVAPAAAPDLMVEFATPPTVPVRLPLIVPALSKDLVLSGLLPAFYLCFSVEHNLSSTLVCEPEVLSIVPDPPGKVPALKLFSLVLSALENTLTPTAVAPSNWKLNTPSVVPSANVVLFGF